MADPAADRAVAPVRPPAHVYVLLVVALVSFSASPILVRLASEAPGGAIAFWRTAIAVLLLSPIALTRIGPEVRRFSRRDWLLIGAAGVLLGFHFAAWIESLYHTSVASASVLVTTTPIFLALFSFFVLRERPTVGLTLAIMLGVPGAVLIGLGDGGAVLEGARPLLGNGLALGAAVLVSGYLLVGRVVRQQTSWLAYVFPLYLCVAVTIALLARGLGHELTGYSWEVYAWCTALAVGPTILGHGTFNYAVKYVSATFLGVLALVEPIGASVLAFMLFGELPGNAVLGGIGLVLIAVACAVVPQTWWQRWLRRGRDG